jgi:hypothetical protein
VLKAKLDKVLGLDGVAPVTSKAEDNFVAPKASAAPNLDEDEDLEYFRSLAEND